MSFELSLAIQYLKKRRHGFFAFITTLVAIGGITIGVAAMIIILSVMNGFREDIQEKTLGIQPHIMVSGTQEDSPMRLAALTDQIQSVRDVQAVAPFVLGQTLLKSKEFTQGIVVRGIEPEKEFLVTQVKKTLLVGDWNDLKPSLKSKQARPIILGKELAKILRLSLGQELLAFSPTQTASLGAMGTIPKIEPFQVVGIFQSGFYEYDSSLAFIHLKDAQSFFNLSGVSGLGIKTNNLNEAEIIARQIATQLESQYYLQSWQSMNQNLFKALKLEKIMMSIILTLIILVASFTIISNLILMTIEKSRDIGILKAMGTSSKSIKKIFLYAGMIFGFIGIVIGGILGISASWILGKTEWIQLPQDVYYIATLPVKISWIDITLVLSSAFLITVLSAVYPAGRAAAINPIDAIRYN
jgi:lipoprotein-releasing system permease protein